MSRGILLPNVYSLQALLCRQTILNQQSSQHIREATDSKIATIIRAVGFLDCVSEITLWNSDYRYYRQTKGVLASVDGVI